MIKTLVFDMDGTIANLYGVEGWLEDLENFNARPYEIATPLYNMVELVDLLKVYKEYGWNIVITSWLSKTSTKKYDNEVSKAKKEWLDKYDFPYDMLNFVEYGYNKNKCSEDIGGYQVLIDDNKEVRDSWYLGKTIDATKNILYTLEDLLIADIQ